MKTIRHIYNNLINELSYVDNPKNETEIIISEYCKIPKQEIYLCFDNIINAPEENQIYSAVHRRQNNEPLQYIIGYTEFFDCKISVNGSVLIPRPETEYLVEMITKARFNSLLDVGTGSGCIAISVKKKRHEILVDAIDISEKAIQTARSNAEQNKTKVSFFVSDVFKNVKKNYDVIVSNPPYIPLNEYEELSPEIINFEPKNALIAEEDGMYFYKKILNEAKEYLTDNGVIYFEIGYNLAERIKEAAIQNGFDKIEVFKDLNGFDRIMRIH